VALLSAKDVDVQRRNLLIYIVAQDLLSSMAGECCIINADSASFCEILLIGKLRNVSTICNRDSRSAHL